MSVYLFFGVICADMKVSPESALLMVFVLGWSDTSCVYILFPLSALTYVYISLWLCVCVCVCVCVCSHRWCLNITVSLSLSLFLCVCVCVCVCVRAG